MSNTSTTNCSAKPTDTSYKNHCKFYGNTKKNCETKSASNRYCTATTTAYNSCHTSPSSTSEKYYCPFVGDVHAGDCDTKSTASLYCSSTTDDYNNCKSIPSSASERYYCPFVGEQHAGSCEAQIIRVSLGSEIYFDDQQEVLYEIRRYDSSNFHIFVSSLDGRVLEESKKVRREGNTTFLATFDNYYTIVYHL